jgi:hypothetical protein
MITKLTPEDFLKLGNPRMCNSYIFMMADSIGKLFDDLRIRPRRQGDSGVVLFQKVDTLRKQTEENKQVCITIAYFYIRIFQLFGALAMTILDDPGAGEILGVIRYGAPAAPGPVRKFPGQKGPYPLQGGEGDEGGAIQEGGANERFFASGKSREFLPMKELFLDGELNRESRGNPRIVFIFKDMTNVEYIPERIDENKQPQNLRIAVGDTNTKRLYGNMRLSSPSVTSGIRSYKFILENFRYIDRSIESEILSNINSKLRKYQKTIDITTLDNGFTWIGAKGKPFVELFETILNDVGNIIEKIQQNPYEVLEDLNLNDKKRKQQNINEYGRAIRPDVENGYKKANALSVGITPGLQNEYIIQTLKGIAGQKSVAFCIARAFQLLDANSLFQSRPTKGTSSICKSVFSELPTSVPQPGKPISKVPGIKSVDQLFYTESGISSQKDQVIMRVGDAAEYAEFLKTLSGLFGSSASAPLKGVDAILAKNPNCVGAAANHYLQITDPATLGKVLQVISRLFKRQLLHTQRVIQFFKQRLFIILKRSDSSIPHVDIHPKLLQGGTDELAKVSKEVRDILIDYYKGCEELYQEGIQVILQSGKYVPV